MLLFAHHITYYTYAFFKFWKRSDWLPPYDEEGVTEILKDIEDVHSSLAETLGYGRREEDDINSNEDDPIRTLTDSEKVKAWYLNDCLQRNCRYLNRCGEFRHDIDSNLCIFLYWFTVQSFFCQYVHFVDTSIFLRIALYSEC